jgi:sugar/nucleoside kinase (ribokinase family)
MANAVAQFGMKTHCIGAFGHPAIDPVFTKMPVNTFLHSFANPGFTSALEFSDGKIMLAQMADLNGATWEMVKERIGLDQLIKIVKDSDIICLLNWSEVRHTNQIWEGLLKEIFPLLNQKSRMKIFFDLSDCSKHGFHQIRTTLDLIRQFSVDCDVTLSLNRNEADMVYQAIESSSGKDLEVLGSTIFDYLNIKTLVIHTSGTSMAWKDSASYQSDAFVLENPAISTGAGDNFNAGFCIGQLLELETTQALLLANLLAACYMKNGTSPGLAELLCFVEGY